MGSVYGNRPACVLIVCKKSKGHMLTLSKWSLFFSQGTRFEQHTLRVFCEHVNTEVLLHENRVGRAVYGVEGLDGQGACGGLCGLGRRDLISEYEAQG